MLVEMPDATDARVEERYGTTSTTEGTGTTAAWITE